jgi:hypothetical protein
MNTVELIVNSSGRIYNNSVFSEETTSSHKSSNVEDTSEHCTSSTCTSACNQQEIEEGTVIHSCSSSSSTSTTTTEAASATDSIANNDDSVEQFVLQQPVVSPVQDLHKPTCNLTVTTFQSHCHSDQQQQQQQDQLVHSITTSSESQEFYSSINFVENPTIDSAVTFSTTSTDSTIFQDQSFDENNDNYPEEVISMGNAQIITKAKNNINLQRYYQYHAQQQNLSKIEQQQELPIISNKTLPSDSPVNNTCNSNITSDNNTKHSNPNCNPEHHDITNESQPSIEQSYSSLITSLKESSDDNNYTENIDDDNNEDCDNEDFNFDDSNFTFWKQILDKSPSRRKSRSMSIQHQSLEAQNGDNSITSNYSYYNNRGESDSASTLKTTNLRTYFTNSKSITKNSISTTEYNVSDSKPKSLRLTTSFLSSSSSLMSETIAENDVITTATTPTAESISTSTLSSSFRPCSQSSHNVSRPAMVVRAPSSSSVRFIDVKPSVEDHLSRAKALLDNAKDLRKKLDSQRIKNDQTD